MYKCITNKTADVNISLDTILKVVEEVDKHIYEATQIFLANPVDLLKINMSVIPRNAVFISNFNMNEGTMAHVKDGELKRDLYKFIEEHPDRVFRGQK